MNAILTKRAKAISTHALHEEGDGHALSYLCPPETISTHALHEEGDSKCDGKTSILPLTFVH